MLIYFFAALFVAIFFVLYEEHPHLAFATLGVSFLLVAWPLVFFLAFVWMFVLLIKYIIKMDNT